MIVKVHNDDTGTYADIIPTDAEVQKLCGVGKGDDCCVWLRMTPGGCRCSYYNKPIPLLVRWEKGETNAKRNGCDFVKNHVAPGTLGVGEHTVKVRVM